MAIVILLGLTGAASMTPTSGITEKLYGADHLATLFGVIFLSHQVGSFFSAWIGGLSVELTGDYIVVWMIAIVLSLLASIATFKIKDK
jgi:predicted MFS family arabinose efflux permease